MLIALSVLMVASYRAMSQMIGLQVSMFFLRLCAGSGRKNIINSAVYIDRDFICYSVCAR